MDLPILYKYSKIDYLLNTIQNQKFKWSSIDEFNDPFEGRFHIDKNIKNSIRLAALSASINKGLHIPLDYQIIINLGINNGAPGLESINEISIKINDAIQRNGQELTKELYFEIERIIWNATKTSSVANKIYSNALDLKQLARRVFAEKYGVLSLGTKFNHPLMWGHYASDHTGVMFEFDFNKLEKDDYLYTGIKKVDYKEEYPIMSYDVLLGLNGKLFTGQKDEFNRILNLTKQKEWEYEGEYRSIFSINHLDGSRLASIPKECFKSITLGCNSDESKYKTIVNLINKNLPSTKVYVNKLDPLAYKLIRTEI